jgi:hypothetical protein
VELMLVDKFKDRKVMTKIERFIVKKEPAFPQVKKTQNYPKKNGNGTNNIKYLS